MVDLIVHHPSDSELVGDPPVKLDRTWTKSLAPGHNFVWFNQFRRTFYSIVLHAPAEPPLLGYHFTKTFNATSPEGFNCHVRDDLPAVLLSEEQMKLAK